MPKDRGGRTEPRSPVESDIEIECNIDSPPLIPEGNYEVGFVRAERKDHLWGRSKIFLHFRVLTPGDHHGKSLFMGMNLPTNGNVSLSSKFLQQWTIASGCPSRRRDRLSTKAFKNKVFLGAVRTVTKYVHTTGKLKDRDPSTFYSVVDHLIEVRAGL